MINTPTQTNGSYNSNKCYPCNHYDYQTNIAITKIGFLLSTWKAKDVMGPL